MILIISLSISLSFAAVLITSEVTSVFFDLDVDLCSIIALCMSKSGSEFSYESNSESFFTCSLVRFASLMFSKVMISVSAYFSS